MHAPTHDSPVVLYVHVDDDARVVTDGLTHAEPMLSVRAVEAADALPALDDAVDCVVGDGDALPALRQIADANPDCPTILYADAAADATVTDALDAGVTDCVQRMEDGHALLARRVQTLVERNQFRRQLRAERDQHRRLFEDAPVMYAVFRSVENEPVIEDCNDHFLDRLGYEREELLGRSVWDLYAEESMADAVPGFESGQRGTFGYQERVLLDTDGNRVVTLFRASPRLDADGDVIGTVGLYVDITERTRREQTLDRLHDVTRELLRAETPTEVAEFVTDAVRDVLGYPTNLVRLVDEEASALRPAAITSAAEETLGERPVYAVGEGTAGRAFAARETTVYDDVQAVDDDYDRPGIHASMFVPIGDHGVLCIGDTSVGTFDKSDRHLAETFAANAAAALTLLDRTVALEAQNDRLDEFASVVSHDLRSPLTVADGSLELARERYGDDADLDRAARSLDRAFDLIDDVLTLARDDGGPIFDAIDLAAIVDSCWQTTETDGATLIVDTDQTIRADEARLRRLLENLLRNSVEHGSTTDTASDDRHVTVTVGALDDGFYVADDGPGIPADGDVFTSGYTGAATGTGLGLSIVKRIADEHGWSAAVDRSADGARFEFRDVEVD